MVEYLISRLDLVLGLDKVDFYCFNAIMFPDRLRIRQIISLPTLIKLEPPPSVAIFGDPLEERLSGQLLESMLMSASSQKLIMRASNINFNSFTKDADHQLVHAQT